MTQPRYPKAEYLGDGGRNGDGLGWGPLPDTIRGASLEQLRVVFHTTEGSHLPGYREGWDAPHLTYSLKNGKWWQHNEFHHRVGTLVGISTTGVLGNEFSVQVEIIGYSDKRLADMRGPSHIWVGHATDENYADLAHFIRWARGHLFVPHLPLTRAYGPSVDFDTFVWGLNDSRELNGDAWLNAGGILTGHGAGDNQRHWDPGVLDLHRIIRESLPEPPDTATDWAKARRLAREIWVLADEHL